VESVMCVREQREREGGRERDKERSEAGAEQSIGEREGEWNQSCVYGSSERGREGGRETKRDQRLGQSRALEKGRGRERERARVIPYCGSSEDRLASPV